MKILKSAPVLLSLIAVLLLAGCRPKGPETLPMCQLGHQNIGDVSDGDSAQLSVKITDQQKITIRYIASWDSGRAEWQIIDDQATLLWRQDVKQATDETVISVPLDLKVGTYRLIEHSYNLKKQVICWKVEAAAK